MGNAEAEREHEAEEHRVPEGELVYRTIRRDGDAALQKPSGELAWSGLAAGMSMGFSLGAEGLLRAHLPEARWTPLLTSLGYAVGFLIVILGRQQLFTEQTLTAILPLLSRDRPGGVLRNVARMWAVVLSANVLGAAVFAAASAWTPAFTPEVRSAFGRIGAEALQHGFGTTFVGAIFAGFLIATTIWLLPGAGAARFWIVIVLTYIIGVAGFAHVIAGSATGLFMVFSGARPLTDYVIGYFLPSLLGNSIGGVVLVAALAHAQHAPDESR